MSKKLNQISNKSVSQLSEYTLEQPPSPYRLIRLPEVMHISGLPRSSIYEMMGKKLFPRSVRISARSVAWSELDVRKWISTCLLERRLRLKCKEV